MPIDLLSPALKYFDRGLAVVPIGNGTKAPIISGWQKKKLSRAELENYFSNGTDITGIGIISGELSGNLAILDFDGKNWQHAFEHFKTAWEDDILYAPIVETGSGKRHIYIKIPSLPPKFTNQKFKQGEAVIELRGNRSNNLAPPSLHPCGGYYRWLTEDADLPEIDFNELRSWLAEWGETVRETPKGNQLGLIENSGQHTPLPVRTLNFIVSPEPQPEGTRNDELYAAAQQLCAAGYPLDEAKEILKPVAERTGLDKKEIEPTIESGYKGAADFAPAVYSDTPLLPKSAWLPDGLGYSASPWLDNYIEWSRKYSPRSFDGFHEAVGLWLLSTIAARRVVLHLGKPRFTPLYIALCARTSLYAKSSAADNGEATLRAVDLDYLLAPDDSSPQKFIHDMTRTLPKDYDSLPEPEQNRVKLRLAFAGQRGWFYEEFGQHLAAISNERGTMADFRGILRRFDDLKEKYVYATIGRGSDLIERPYLALLANMTPADLRPLARRGGAMWNDGFWARFAFVAPPTDERKRDRYPKEERIVPAEIMSRLREWHQRLGVPQARIVDILNDEGEPTGKKGVEVEPVYPRTCVLDEGVYDAFYNYHDALLDIIERSYNTDLDGNYTRFAEKALRIAMLLASLENDNRIELNHWAKAQDIAERWRVGLHTIYNQVNTPDISEQEQREERVLIILQRHGRQTAADVARYIRGMSSADVAQVCESLVSSGLVEPTETGRTIYYEIH